ncbi:class I SAM-dependent methyltransferase [Kibdelosporangium aridum]|uniref:Ubiquinone/menaquinone biosynthesis C-methylase UbiE n=1 Tax=Kibdelosporangium aridum TaxID=2030 RepID=A0A1W2B2T4_KIBAR|nr:class I SAM-dependent methyltransferase [Kibdelosporangium aridum]SMC67293.1 Ubiquinone/menaquinone biosynthesis C-methylase UbiE [Kibdelosporangium aridum]
MIVVDALTALADGSPDLARDVLTRPSPEHPKLQDALAKYLDGEASRSVYDQPAAFEAFINLGDNVPLYKATSAALAALYREHEVTSLLDIGCGDGMALVPALAETSVGQVTLVEPSQALLQAAVAKLNRPVTQVPATLGEFVDGLDAHFDLAESTFAMHTMPHQERSTVLAALRPHVGRIAIVEFDVPEHEGTDWLRFLADTYERGVSQFDSDLVSQGFLMPVLVGQLVPGAVRSTWEQPAKAWVDQFTACGYEDVRAEPLSGYWWSPAFLLTAAGQTSRSR